MFTKDYEENDSRLVCMYVCMCMYVAYYVYVCMYVCNTGIDLPHLLSNIASPAKKGGW